MKKYLPLFFVLLFRPLEAQTLHGVSYFVDTIWVSVMYDTTTNMLFSMDNGITWYRRSAQVGTEFPSLWDCEFVNSRTGWAGGIVSFVFHTDDAGNTWQIQNYGGSKYVTRLKFLDELRGWGAAGDAIYFRTVDGGRTWEWFFVMFEVITDLYGVAPLNENICYAAGGVPAELPGGQGYVFVTYNGGLTWDSLYHSTIYDLLDIAFFDNLRGLVVGGMDSHPYRAIILRTENGGLSFDSVPLPQNVYTLRAIDVRGNKAWACGKFGTIIKSNDYGQTWIRIPTPTQVTLFDIEFYNDLNGCAVGDSGVVLITYDGGNTWIRRNVVHVFDYPEDMAQNTRDIIIYKGRIVSAFPKINGDYLELFDLSGRRVGIYKDIPGFVGAFESLEQGVFIFRVGSKVYRVLNLR